MIFILSVSLCFISNSGEMEAIDQEKLIWFIVKRHFSLQEISKRSCEIPFTWSHLSLSQYPTPALCKCFSVSTRGYYQSLTTAVTQRRRDEKHIEVEISTAHKCTRGTYGPNHLLTKKTILLDYKKVTQHKFSQSETIRDIGRRLIISCNSYK